MPDGALRSERRCSEGPAAWAAIVAVCHRWRRLAKAAITAVSLQERAGRVVGQGEPAQPLSPALAAAFPALTRLSLEFLYVPHDDLSV
eukprot:SM000167S02985  [mRNA]  locus=s167:206056:206319:- [translate_table: standard]